MKDLRKYIMNNKVSIEIKKNLKNAGMTANKTL